MTISKDVQSSLSTWWQGPEFPRFVTDLLVDAVAYLRPGAPIAKDSAAAADFGPRGFDLDSLERFNLAVTLAEALQFMKSERPERLQEMNSITDWIAEARRCLWAGSGGIGFRTSGSTGKRKFVIHEFDDLAQEIESLASIFSDRSRVVSVVAGHHIYGFLFTVLLPLRLGVTVVDARAHASPTMRTILNPGDLLVAFPTYWQSLAGSRWPEDVTGVTSGAPCSRELGEVLYANGLGRLVDVYGSTETGGIAWREDGNRPFRLMPHITRDDEHNVRKATGGSSRSYALPNHVTWEGPDLLTPRSRKDGAVQIGAVNVYLDAVCAVLLAHPGVADAEVRLMRPDEGERIKAYIVARDAAGSSEQLRRDLEAWVTSRLQPLERPRAYTFGTAVPTSAMGKRTDWRIDSSSAQDSRSL
jgi:long-chain acyl-CoA synthetase